MRRWTLEARPIFRRMVRWAVGWGIGAAGLERGVGGAVSRTEAYRWMAAVWRLCCSCGLDRWFVFGVQGAPLLPRPLRWRGRREGEELSASESESDEEGSASSSVSSEDAVLSSGL